MKKIISTVAIAVLTAGLVACGKQPQAPQPKDAPAPNAVTDESQKDFKTLEDRFSYAYGADLGKKFKEEGIELNVALMAAGMQSAFDGKEKKMSAEEVIATLEMYREVHLKEKEAQQLVAAEKNKKEGAAFLTTNAKKEGVVVTKSGLQYKILTKGTGTYKPTIEDEVQVHYRARFVDGTEFESTYERNKPYSANAKMLIDGWAEALLLMTKGAKWELYIPANLAYGDRGSPPHVGPDAVLIFEMELIDIEKK